MSDCNACFMRAVMNSARLRHRLSLKKKESNTSANSPLSASFDIAFNVSPKLFVVPQLRLRGKDDDVLWSCSGILSDGVEPGGWR